MAIATCHPTKVNKGRGLCGSCYDRWLKSVNPEYHKRQLLNTSAWFQKHPDRRRELNRQRRLREFNDPLRAIKKRAAGLKSKYGLSLENYAKMLEEQNGGCAICFRKPGKRPLHVDHNHTTGQVRGLLCHQCNWYLGTIESDPTILLRLQAYLGKN